MPQRPLPQVFLASLVVLALGAPSAALDSLVVGQDQNPSDWRSIADWGEVSRTTVTFDSVFKWNVRARDNLSTGLLARGGRVIARYQVVEEDSTVEVTGPLPGLDRLVDGDPRTAFDPDRAGQTGVPRDLRITIDLGAPFSINRIRLHPRLDENNRIRYPQQFRVSTIEGGAADGASVVVSQLNFGPFQPNAEPLVDRVFTSRQARYVLIDLEAVQPWELAEVEIYSDGTLPVGQYQSRPLSARRQFPVWGRVRYDGGAIADLPVVVQTRTGPDRRPLLYYRFTGVADDIALLPGGEGQWSALPPEEQGPVRTNPDWGEWRNLVDGVVQASDLHRYLQFRIRFSEPGTVIRKLIFEYTTPALVKRLQAEVSPARVPAGQEQAFTVSVLAHMITRNEALAIGFRQLEVRTAASVAAVTGVLIDDRPVAFSSSIEPGEGFTVNLGRRIEQDGTFLQVRFRGTLFRDATRFEVIASDRQLTDGRLERVTQIAQAGDIDLTTAGGQLVVRLDEDDLQALGPVAARPAVLTPNGDGINDETLIAFDLFKLTRPTPATLDILDLAGRRVRRLLDEPVGDGRREIRWDGTDDAGRRVAPGTYLFRVELDGDQERLRRSGLIGVAF